MKTISVTPTVLFGSSLMTYSTLINVFSVFCIIPVSKWLVSESNFHMEIGYHFENDVLRLNISSTAKVIMGTGPG